MNFIRKIEVRNFRSLFELEIDELSDVNVFSGVNDVGKSNIIKALNLFFNNQVDWKTPLNMDLDTNSFHEVTRKFRKKGAEIHVKLEFNRPVRRYETSLDEQFWIQRIWKPDNSSQPETTWGEFGQKKSRSDTPRAITEILNRTHFLYVPAVRGQDYFRYLVGEVAHVFASKPSELLDLASRQTSEAIESASSDLVGILEQLTGLRFDYRLPNSMLALLQASGFDTEGNIPIQMRGDGVQGMVVPAILEYLSKQKASDYYFWGFEEPENSLEYKRAAELTDKIRDVYSKNTQIFLTTHSPAFIAMENAKTSIFRVSRREQTYEQKQYVEQVTDIQPVFVRGDFRENLLPRDLGLLMIARQFDRDNREADELGAKIELLEETIRLLSKPILIVEGPNDEATLAHAWHRLYEDSISFNFLAAHGVKEVTPLVKRWALPDEKRMCALCDHDKAGVGPVNSLLKSDFAHNSVGPYRSAIKHNMLAMTLPPPKKEGGLAQAQNLNLTLEFYFPDDVLCDIHDRSGGQLFSQTHYVQRGEHKENIDEFLDITSSQMKFRLLKQEGKTYLVDNLCTLKCKDFLAFHDLFEIVLAHLMPSYEPTLKPNVVNMLAERESRTEM